MWVGEGAVALFYCGVNTMRHVQDTYGVLVIVGRTLKVETPKKKKKKKKTHLCKKKTLLIIDLLFFLKCLTKCVCAKRWIFAQFVFCCLLHLHCFSLMHRFPSLAISKILTPNN